MTAAAMAWLIVAGLIVLALLILFIRELPSIRRELRIFRM